MTTRKNDPDGPPEVSPCTPSIGAIITGVDLSKDLSESDADFLYDALLKHLVLFFHDQHVTPEQLSGFASNFGPLQGRHHTYESLEGFEHVTVLDMGPENPPDSAEWHADLTFGQDAAFASALQGIEVPSVGGDTLWANCFAVHDALPSGLRKDLEELSAVHDMGSFRSHAYESGGVDGINERMESVGSAVHPIIDHHPVTGRPFVNVNETFTVHILGMAQPESRRLLNYLFDLINRPQFHVRLRWQPGTVALWDNRGSQHYATDDYLPERRVMHRVVVESDVRQPNS